MPDSRGDRAHQPRHRAGREPLPEARSRLPRAARCAARSGARTAPRSRRRRRQAADVEGQLDRRAGEVEVRSFEDPELDERRHAADTYRRRLSVRPHRVEAAVDVHDLAGGRREEVATAARTTACAVGSVVGLVPAQRRAVASTSPRAPRSRGSPWRPASSAGRRRPGCSGCPRARGRGRGSGSVDSSAALATPIQSYAGQATVASKVSPTTEPPRRHQRPAGHRPATSASTPRPAPPARRPSHGPSRNLPPSSVSGLP